MKKFLSLLAVAMVAVQLWAAPVDVSTAKSKAEQYLAQKVYAGKYMAPAATQAKLIKTEMGEKAQTPVYYIFNTETTFVIVSGDDRAEEVLAYGDRPLNL
ncbi:MAG: Spi family protease inhibitor, partial [Muribaculaceae bacterium]|nr:Spi family protease inhibitor [Muribaculaceae bacterium]